MKTKLMLVSDEGNRGRNKHLNLNYKMSRLPTIYEGENELYQNKLNMLQSNINRVQSQNRKLQALLEHADQFDKLRQCTIATQTNWTKLAALADRINAMNGLLKTTRDQYHSSVTQLNHHITKHIISDLTSIKTKNKEHESRLNEMTHRWRSRIRKDIAPLKDKLQKEMALRKQEYLVQLEACESSFKKEFEERIIPRIAVNLEDIFDEKYRNCRTELGHVQNLLEYYANRDKIAKFQPPEQKKEAIQIEAAILQQSAIKEEYNQMQKTISTVISTSCNRINAETESIELRLKRVNSEINWIKNQQKGKKKSNRTETSFSSDINTENLHLVELQQQIDNLNCEALGLGKHFDRYLVERKLLRSSFSNWSQLEDQQRQFLLRNGQRMLTVRQRISKISSKLNQYSQFYKLVNS